MSFPVHWHDRILNFNDMCISPDRTDSLAVAGNRSRGKKTSTSNPTRWKAWTWKILHLITGNVRNDTHENLRNRKTSEDIGGKAEWELDVYVLSMYWKWLYLIIVMVSSLARLGRCRAIMTHPKLLAPLTTDMKLVCGRVELPATIFGCSIRMLKEAETKNSNSKFFWRKET